MSSIVVGLASQGIPSPAQPPESLSAPPIYRPILCAAFTLFLAILALRSKRLVLTPQPLDPEVRALPAWLWLASAATLFLFVQILASSILSILPTPAEPLHASALAAGLFYSLAILLSLAASHFAYRSTTSSRFALRIRPLILGVLLFLPLIPALMLISDLAIYLHILLKGSRPDLIAHHTLRQILDHRTSPAAWALMAGAVLGAPIFEEVVYRGFLQTALRTLTRSPWPAIILAAAAFALMHRAGAAPVPWHAIPTIFSLGLACGYATEKWGVSASIGLHIAFNAANLLLALLLTNSP